MLRVVAVGERIVDGCGLFRTGRRSRFCRRLARILVDHFRSRHRRHNLRRVVLRFAAADSTMAHGRRIADRRGVAERIRLLSSVTGNGSTGDGGIGCRRRRLIGSLGLGRLLQQGLVHASLRLQDDQEPDRQHGGRERNLPSQAFHGNPFPTDLDTAPPPRAVGPENGRFGREHIAESVKLGKTNSTGGSAETWGRRRISGARRWRPGRIRAPKPCRGRAAAIVPSRRVSARAVRRALLRPRPR